MIALIHLTYGIIFQYIVHDRTKTDSSKLEMYVCKDKRTLGNLEEEKRVMERERGEGNCARVHADCENERN